MNLLTKMLFREQMKWTLWFFAFVFLFHSALIGFSVYFREVNEAVGGFLPFSFAPFGTYMLIIGLCSPYRFLTQYAHLGQTRKAYFKSSLLASTMIVTGFSFIAVIITVVQQVIARMTNWLPDIQGSMQETIIQSANGHISIDLTGLAITGFNFDDAFLLSLFIFIIKSIFYYMIGWFVGVGIYRFGWLRGMLFIVIGLVLLNLFHWVWGAIVINATGSILLSVLTTIILLVLIGYMIWKTVSKTPIRLY